MSDLELQSQLVRIWESVLAKRGIGVHDSFWDLGGNSLTALRLMRRVERLAGVNLPVTTLLQVPTISEMAVLLRQSREGKVGCSLVAIQPIGSKPPLFCVHAMGGMVVGFRSLAWHLGTDQPVYGLQAQGMDGKGRILSRVEDMAAHYLGEVRAVQSRGPYYFAGRCFGGWIAYEMAQQLRERGEEVGLLALFDTYFVNWSRGALMGKLAGLPPAEVLKVVVQRGHFFRKFLVEPVQHFFLPRAFRPVRKGLRIAARDYVPRPYAGRIILFQADEKSVRDAVDRKSGWGALATGTFERQPVPGDHNSMFAEPQAAILAQQLAACLEEVREERTVGGASRVG
jgi:thioesterase domain-containing protein